MAHIVKRLALWSFGILLCIGLIRVTYWASSSAWVSPALTQPPQITVWKHTSANFGGLSALLIENNGRSLTAGSDRGSLFNATVQRDAAGNIEQITDITEFRIQLPKGGPVDRFKGDLEGLSRLQNGGLALSFEGYSRIMTMKTLKADTVWTHQWDRFESYFSNSAFEGLATLPDGRLMAIVEKRARYGMARAYVQNGPGWGGPYPIPVTPRFRITGADVGPDGCLYTLERRFNLFAGIEYNVRRHWQDTGLWTPKADWHSETLYTSAMGRDGNGEGLSVWADTEGLRITVITDDGFLPIPHTQLVELSVEGGDCR